MRLETLAAHAGHGPDPATGAVTPPIYLSSTFERGEDGGYPSGFSYSRENNPNRAQLESALAALEAGAEAAAFSSGQAATMTVFQALAPGDHVIAPQDAYFGTGRLLREVFMPWGLTVSFVDMTDHAAVAGACRAETKLIWMETPSNPVLKITDIAAVVAIARRAGARTAVDNTWSSPVCQRPLELGADLVMHSTTKYLGGHSDVLGGALIARDADEHWLRIRTLQRIGGAVPSPFECWLVLRGLRSLPVRVRAQTETAGRIARYLADHPAVEQVHYPGLSSHPGHEVARAQMSGGFGAMLSIQVPGGRAEAMAFSNRLRLFTRATSLGGTESLIEHRESIEGPTTTTPTNLLRISIGLEYADDLIEDLAQALD